MKMTMMVMNDDDGDEDEEDEHYDDDDNDHDQDDTDYLIGLQGGAQRKMKQKNADNVLQSGDKASF